MDSMRPVVQAAGQYGQLRYLGAVHDDAEAGHALHALRPLQGGRRLHWFSDLWLRSRAVFLTLKIQKSSWGSAQTDSTIESGVKNGADSMG